MTKHRLFIFYAFHCFLNHKKISFAKRLFCPGVESKVIWEQSHIDSARLGLRQRMEHVLVIIVGLVGCRLLNLFSNLQFLLKRNDFVCQSLVDLSRLSDVVGHLLLEMTQLCLHRVLLLGGGCCHGVHLHPLALLRRALWQVV